MTTQEQLLQQLLSKHPDLQQLSDAQIKSATADAFGSGTGEQRIAYMLLRYGKLNDIATWQDVRGLVDSYTRVLNVDEDMVEQVIETCLHAMGKQMPSPVAGANYQSASRLVPSVPLQQNNRRVKVRNRAERQQQLDAHPQVPYPPYTLWENMRDYAWGGMLDFVLTTVIWICGVIFGVPAYLISLFFDYIGKSHWNMYLWCAYGALCLYALYKGIERYIEQKNIAIRDHRGGYHDEERLQKIIANKGYTRKAEEIMRAAYRQARAIKNDSTVTYLSSIFERAYQDALEDVMCYFDEDTRWWYLEIYDGEGGRSECLLSYSCLYEKFYGNEAFNPKKYQADIFGHFDFGIPVW